MLSRRTFAAGAAAAVAASLSGCSRAGGGGGRRLLVEIGANTNFPAEQRAWFRQVSERFRSQTGATVDFDTYSSPAEEVQRLQTSVLSAQGPDVWMLGTSFTTTAYASGSFLRLDDAAWSEIGGRDRFVPASLGISGPDADHDIGIPFASRPYVMAVNRRLLQRAGIDRPATTWDGLTEQAKRLTGKGVHGFAVAYADGFDPWKFAWGMAIQAGQQLVTGKQAHLASPAVARAYRTYFDWLTKDRVVDPSAIGWKQSQSLAAFADGKAAILLMVSSGAAVTLDTSKVKDEYEFALMPTVPPGATTLPPGGKPASGIISGDNMVIAQYTKDRSLALKLVKMLTEADAQVDYQKRFGDLPTNAEAAKRVAASKPTLAPVVASGGKSVGTPFTGAWATVQLNLLNVVVQAIPNLSRGRVSDADIRAALATAQDNVQTALDQLR